MAESSDRPQGRPMKYRDLLLSLEDDDIYTPSTIATLAKNRGMFESAWDDPKGIRLEHQRIRITMGRFSNNNNFPDKGDGQVVVPGQPPIPGWFGWRWKAAIKS